ncbi:hypothetical protein QE152_g33578 [Popillia japonica]|uniref:Zinc finger PHD-type domain-containing protein n=1 Tax=Popillia japonica TaxID=7064 RepID=A0AAW1IWM6_POPJA
MTTNTQKAINSRVIVLKKSLFLKKNETQDVVSKLKGKPSSSTPLGRGIKKTSRKFTKKESWYCNVCKEDAVKDMRMCISCAAYAHEECVGLTKSDKDPFICPNCEN